MLRVVRFFFCFVSMPNLFSIEDILLFFLFGRRNCGGSRDRLDRLVSGSDAYAGRETFSYPADDSCS
jgi:hypothetical protein